MTSELPFAIFSMIVIVAAWRVVTTPNVVRAALALVIVLAGMAPLFILLAAEFVALIQVLVYVGSVIVLFLFGIMLTRSPTGRDHDHNNRRRWPALLIATVLFATLWYAIRDSFGGEEVVPRAIGRAAGVGDVMLRSNVVAFEAVSVLLLAALIGSIVLARRD